MSKQKQTIEDREEMGRERKKERELRPNNQSYHMKYFLIALTFLRELLFSIAITKINTMIIP